MSSINIEIAIIGGGVIGSSTAYHLAHQGHNVLVIEQAPDVASTPAASWASAGGVRRQGRHPAEAQLASEAIERWQTLEQELEADLHYRRGGNLLLAESEVDAEQLETFVHHQHDMGFCDVRLLNREEVRGLVPALNARVVAGSYSPKDGQADPVRTTRAFASAAQRYGAIYWNGTAALSLLVTGERVTGIETARGRVQAERATDALIACAQPVRLVTGKRPVSFYRPLPNNRWLVHGAAWKLKASMTSHLSGLCQV